MKPSVKMRKRPRIPRASRMATSELEHRFGVTRVWGLRGIGGIASIDPIQLGVLILFGHYASLGSTPTPPCIERAKCDEDLGEKVAAIAFHQGC